MICLNLIRSVFMETTETCPQFSNELIAEAKKQLLQEAKERNEEKKRIEKAERFLFYPAQSKYENDLRTKFKRSDGTSAIIFYDIQKLVCKLLGEPSERWVVVNGKDKTASKLAEKICEALLKD